MTPKIRLTMHSSTSIAAEWDDESFRYHCWFYFDETPAAPGWKLSHKRAIYKNRKAPLGPIMPIRLNLDAKANSAIRQQIERDVTPERLAACVDDYRAAQERRRSERDNQRAADIAAGLRTFAASGDCPHDYKPDVRAMALGLTNPQLIALAQAINR